MSILSFSTRALQNLSTSSLTKSVTFSTFIELLETILPTITPLVSPCNRPITFTFEHQVKSLIYYHIGEYSSAQALLQDMQNDESIKYLFNCPEGFGQSTFYEANSSRGVTQMLEVFDRLAKKVSICLKIAHAQLGNLVVIDGSLIDASLSMIWADYKSGSNKAKVHIGFDLNRSIPIKLYLTEGKGSERPFVSYILESGQTGVVDRGYQDHDRFDEWIDDKKHFVARLKNNTKWDIIETLPFTKGGKIFFFAKVWLGDENHKMRHPVYLVGFRVRKKVFWVATDRADLTAEEIAFIYSLRWEIEKFFSWWKCHMKVYHLISRNRHGLLLQLLSGLITYLLLVLYCYHQYNESQPSILRLRQLRSRIRKEMGCKVYVINIYNINIEVIAFLLLFYFDAIF